MLRQAALEHLWLYGRQPVEMAEEGGPVIMAGGEGCTVWDSEGNRYLDAMSGLWLKNIGYGRREVAEAAYKQMLALTYHPSGTTTEPTIRLAQRVAGLTPGDLSRCFFVNSGSEANETAMKLAKAYHRRRGNAGKYKFISRKGSFHGGTLGALSLGGGTGRFGRADYEPLPAGFLYAPQPDPYRCELGGTTPSECAARCAQAIEDIIKFNGAETVAGVVAEPVSSPPGAAVPGPEYWPMLRDICGRHDVLLIADEVITGFGRTGRMFGMEHWDVVPDIMTMAKGLTSGYLPMAAVVARKHIGDAFLGGEDSTFRHIVTWGGHPVCSAAALANLDIMEGEGLVDNAREMGDHLIGGLRELAERHPSIGMVRGLGLMTSAILVKDRGTKERFPPEAQLAKRLSEKFRARGVLAGGGDSVQLMPPLCVTRDECDRLVEVTGEALGEIEKELGVTA